MENQMIPIPADLQPGPETAQWVYDQITTFPETHNQSDWYRPSETCGTKACVAGWAGLAHGDEFLQVFMVKGPCECGGHGGMRNAVDWAHAGMVALALDPVEADELFRGRNSREGVLHALKALANGERPDLQHLRDTRNEF